MKRRPEFAMPRVVRRNDDADIRIDSIEPRDWWIGMVHNVVMLTIYGHNAALTRPRVKGEGVSMRRSVTTDSANHLFVEIEITPQAKPGEIVIELTHDGQCAASLPFELRMRRQGSANRQGLDSSDAIYLAMPDRFAHAAGGGDANGMKEQPDRRKPYGRHGGNLRGLARHTDYLHALGVTALWLTPVQTNDMESQSYHGYAITDHYSIDPRLGSLADYKTLSANLAQWGVKLVMDIVVNHCGTGHKWMADAPSSRWFNSWDWKPELTNYRTSVATDTHASAYDRRRTIEGWFDTTMADLNMADPLVERYMTQMAIWWVETADLRGLRVDTMPYSDIKALGRWVDEVRREYPNLGIVGETWVGHTAMLASWQKAWPGAQPPMAMDFPLQESVCRAFREDFAWGTGANRLYDTIACDAALPAPQGLMIFGDNHDTGRLLTRLGGDTEALRLALAFLLTTRGMPQIYYGTEMLMEGDSDKGHADIRRDMPGGWDGDRENWFSLALQDREGKSRLSETSKERQRTFDFTANLLRFRRQSEAIKTGAMTHFIPTENTYVYFRSAKTGQVVMVALNLGHKTARLNIERFTELTGATLTGRNIITGTKYHCVKSIRIAPRTPVVIDVETNR